MLKEQKCTLYDYNLIWISLSLIFVGFIIVASSSISISTRLLNDPFYFSKKHAFYLIITLFSSIITIRIPMFYWKKYCFLMLIITFLMLITVLIFGKSVNGATRWLSLRYINVQPSEFAKFSLICYFADYLSRKKKEIREKVFCFLKPIIIMILFSILLFLQPDFGSIIIIFFLTISMLFLAGAKIFHFLLFFPTGIFLLFFLSFYNPYRMKRLISFWNPWDDPFGKGYQLIQSLIAFGRGNFFGTGLGNSVQKLEYLPEAHTDFIFAILGEEFGYLGVFFMLLMIFSLPFRAMLIGKKALESGQHFSGLLACSIGIWFGIQSSCNIGSVTGLLPTKGLTLPLISYGGSSLFIMYTTVVILLRVDFERRLSQSQAFLISK